MIEWGLVVQVVGLEPRRVTGASKVRALQLDDKRANSPTPCVDADRISSGYKPLLPRSGGAAFRRLLSHTAEAWERMEEKGYALGVLPVWSCWSRVCS
jgi:hypothetical protein